MKCFSFFNLYSGLRFIIMGVCVCNSLFTIYIVCNSVGRFINIDGLRIYL